MTRLRTSFFLAGAICALVALQPSVAVSNTEQRRPNILLIVADDLAYADLGVHGSSIRTPHIDSLAERGLLLTQFHTAPKCAPTRAMLLSGNNNHVAGMALQGVSRLAGHAVPGYEASLSDRIAPLPRLLRDAGYRTLMVGKWHLGLTPEKSPTAAGFQRSFALLDGAGNHWDARGFFEGGSSFWADGQSVEYPAGRYSTEVYTDKLIEFIGNGDRSRVTTGDESPQKNRGASRDDGNAAPFFAFAAYTSPHWPLQVPAGEADRYAGQYDHGYDVLREENFANLKAERIIDPTSTLPPRNPAIRLWDELTSDEQRRESRKMELYAAMVENLDGHVGRLLDHLRDTDQIDNTLVIFMSDNGAANEDFYNEGPFVDYLRAQYDNTYEKMGTPESFVSYDDPWAEAGSAPFSRMKTYTREGGVIAPFIAAGPGVAGEGRLDRSYVTVMDLAPTFLDLANATYPPPDGVQPLLGESMVDFLGGASASVHDDAYVTTLFHAGRALLRQGDWKLTTLEPPFDEARFALYNLAKDPGETTDLRYTHPEKYAAMLTLWREERLRLGIILPEDL